MERTPERRATELERRALVRQPAAPLEIAGRRRLVYRRRVYVRTGRIEWIRPRGSDSRCGRRLQQRAWVRQRARRLSRRSQLLRAPASGRSARASAASARTPAICIRIPAPAATRPTGRAAAPDAACRANYARRRAGTWSGRQGYGGGFAGGARRTISVRTSGFARRSRTA